MFMSIYAYDSLVFYFNFNFNFNCVRAGVGFVLNDCFCVGCVFQFKNVGCMCLTCTLHASAELMFVCYSGLGPVLAIFLNLCRTPTTCHEILLFIPAISGYYDIF